MTLGEFLHPLRKASKGDQVLATLFYFKHFEGVSEVTPTEIKQALLNAQVPRARKANIAGTLTRLVPSVNRLRRGRWEITGKGETDVRQKIHVPEEATGRNTQETRSLAHLARSLTDDNLKAYVEEAISCLGIGAERAAVVFLWSGAIYVTREALWKSGAGDIDAALKKHNPKSRDFRKKGDFANLNDAALLEITVDLDLYEKSEKQQLEQALTLRNHCGHPVKYKPGKHKVAGFIEDLSSIVFQSDR